MPRWPSAEPTAMAEARSSVRCGVSMSMTVPASVGGDGADIARTAANPESDHRTTSLVFGILTERPVKARRFIHAAIAFAHARGTCSGKAGVFRRTRGD